MTIKMNRCYRCGSDKIELYDCGYSSFNACGGKCTKCGYKVESMADGLGKEGLAHQWNNHHKDLKKRVKEIQKLIRNGSKYFEMEISL